MRYILNDEGYIEEISFSNEIECNDKTCTEYTGTIPDGYSSLKEWNENAVIQAYKITDGNLTYDSDKETALLNEWASQLEKKRTEQKILWEGAMFMHGNQSIDLSETVSSQPNGIVLVFSEYANGKAQNWNFSCHFVPKLFVELLPGGGHSFFLNNSKLDLVGTKYLYIGDTRITGNDANDDTGTGGSGITYTNNRWVLRYVIGV